MSSNGAPAGTAQALIGAARELFAERGYDGASIRAITERAGANLGAVTYHFGSKEALYHRVIETFVGPLQEEVRRAAERPGTPLVRIEAMVRAAFDHYLSDPAMPRLVLQQIASGRPAPPPARAWIREAIGRLSDEIRAGQADGTIRAGEPRLLALLVVAPTLFVNLIRRPIEDALGLSLADPATRDAMREHVLAFVRSGLAA